MKKIFLIVVLFLSIVLAPDVYAFNIGVSSTEDYLSGAYSVGDSALVIPPSQKSAIAILYGDFEEDSANLGKIEVSITGANGMNLTAQSSELASGDTISGSGGNYTITVNSASDDFDGTGLFILTMPSVSSTTKYNVSVTAKSYDKNNSLISTKSATIEYIVAVKIANCDNNYNVNITTSAGVPEKVSDFFGINYAISTDSDAINITVTPESGKTEIFYNKDCSIVGDENGMELGVKQNSVNGLKLNYGNENSACFWVSTECYRQWQESTANTNGVMIIGGLDWYESLQYNPNWITLAITRNDNRSKVNTLKSLSISDVTINFNPDLKNYIATVPYKVSSVKINSTLTDSKSSYVSGYGNRTVDLNEGSNNVLIKVKAENGDETTYTIKITREGNDDATLKSLKVNDKEIKIEKDILLYNEYVNNAVVKAEIKAEANDSKAKVEIDEISELKEGINKVNITVTSVSGKKNIYVVNIIRDKLISENSKLKNITITNHKLDFNSNVNEYVIDIDKNEDKLDIIVETEHSKAKYLIIGNKNLKNNSVIKIKVTAEDGKTTSIYEIKVNKKGGFNFLVLLIPIVVVFGIVFIIYSLIMKNKNKPSKPIPQNNDNNENNTTAIDKNENLNVSDNLAIKKDIKLEENSFNNNIQTNEINSDGNNIIENTNDILSNNIKTEQIVNNDAKINNDMNTELPLNNNVVDNNYSVINENTFNSKTTTLNQNTSLNNSQENITNDVSNNQVTNNNLNVPNADDFWNKINK